MRSAGESSPGSSIPVFVEAVWSGLNDVLTEGLCLAGEVLENRCEGRRPHGAWPEGGGVTRV